MFWCFLHGQSFHTVEGDVQFPYQLSQSEATTSIVILMETYTCRHTYKHTTEYLAVQAHQRHNIERLKHMHTVVLTTMRITHNISMYQSIRTLPNKQVERYTNMLSTWQECKGFTIVCP